VEQAVEQNGEHNQAYTDIEIIPFHQEACGGQDDARDWRRDQQEKTELNDASGSPMERIGHDLSGRAEPLSDTGEVAVVGSRSGFLAQVEDSA